MICKVFTANLALSAVLLISALAQAQSSSGQQAGLTNPGFEAPRVKEEGTFALVETMPGWKTTDKEFEIWGTGFLGFEAHEGTQFVELNAWIDGTLYQDSTGIQLGAVLEFTFAHRGRNGDDTMKLTITDLGADNALGGGDDTVLFTKEYTTGKDAWAVYTSTKEEQIKALGNTVRFAYTAVAAAGGNLGQGNLLDAANFGVGVVSETLEANKIHAGIQNSYEVYGKDLGFGSPDELRDSVLGDPIRIYIWGLDDLEKLGKGDNPLTLMVDAKEVIYPIYSGGMFKSSITLIQVDGKWTFASFGGAEARMADSTRSKHMNATKREPKSKTKVSGANGTAGAFCEEFCHAA